jgi:hypothetical protein
MKSLRLKMFLRGNLAEMMRSGSIIICFCVPNKFVVSQAKDRNFIYNIICGAKEKIDYLRKRWGRSGFFTYYQERISLMTIATL